MINTTALGTVAIRIMTQVHTKRWHLMTLRESRMTEVWTGHMTARKPYRSYSACIECDMWDADVHDKDN